MNRRATYSAGQSWRKWEDPMLDPRFPVKPWWAYKAGMVGFWLVCGSLGALAALAVR
jgi:uncharacterized membrane protein YdcZ (DUF606 family)